MVGNIRDGISDHLGLINRRHGLRLVGKTALDPAELWRVDCRELNHRDFHVTFIMDQLAAQRLSEALNSMFGSTIGGLQGNAPIGKSRADLDDSSLIAWQHTMQCR